MAELDILDVERHAAAFARDVHDLIGIHEQDARLGIEKTANQPRASDAIDFRPPSRHPYARPLWRDAIELSFCDEGQAAFAQPS